MIKIIQDNGKYSLKINAKLIARFDNKDDVAPIGIINISGHDLGFCQYRIEADRNPIGLFDHNRADGLSKCLSIASSACEDEVIANHLMLASDAAEKAKLEQLADIVIQLWRELP